MCHHPLADSRPHFYNVAAGRSDLTSDSDKSDPWCMLTDSCGQRNRCTVERGIWNATAADG